MKDINITRHALVRYTARVHKAAAITDRTFDSWRKRNEKEATELEKILSLEFQKSEYVTTAAYDGNKKAEFYIRRDLMMTYVVNEGNMITCYYIDFGLDDVGNREMLEVLSKNLQRAIEEEEKYDDEHRDKVMEHKNEIAKIKADIGEYEAILSKLKAKKESLEQEINLIDLEKRECAAMINNAREKIVRSKKAM